MFPARYHQRSAPSCDHRSGRRGSLVRKATLGQLPDTFVIDARTDEEIAQPGIFKNTVNIPLDEIPKRMDEIPKDKRIFVHCSTGARADLAYRELVKNGYDVKFLLLDISDPECDCPIIRP